MIQLLSIFSMIQLVDLLILHIVFFVSIIHFCSNFYYFFPLTEFGNHYFFTTPCVAPLNHSIILFLISQCRHFEPWIPLRMVCNVSLGFLWRMVCNVSLGFACFHFHLLPGIFFLFLFWFHHLVMSCWISTSLYNYENLFYLTCQF